MSSNQSKGIYRNWDDHKIVGWIFETPEDVKNAFLIQNNQVRLDRLLNLYEEEFENGIQPLLFNTNIKLNLGGENDKAKLEFTEQPQGIFDFASASSSLYRIAEYFSQEIFDNKIDLFTQYELPLGVVPINLIQTREVGNSKEFYFEDKSTNKKYICEQRQQGLTEALEKNPLLPLKKEGTMTISTQFTNEVKFGSRTKKPYVRYKRRGGKVKYVEIYSLNHYATMGSVFFKSTRHLPALMVCDYLEKQGTFCKLYITRFVQQPGGGDALPTRDIIRKEDITTNAILPLFECAQNVWQRLCLIPQCVKNYGESLNYSFSLGVGGENKQMYTSIFSKTLGEEFESTYNDDAYGSPNWTMEYYEEGFERFRQKYVQYSKKGIWKAKEVKPQGLIMYYDYYLNNYFEYEFDRLKNIYQRANAIDLNKSSTQIIDEVRCLMGNVNFLKWYELYLKIVAYVVKHRLDVFNSNNMAKTFREIESEINTINAEIDFLIRTETIDTAQRFYEGWALDINSRYDYNNVKNYCFERIGEMTYFAEGGCFPTPPEQIKEREEEWDKLRQEILKV